jgi:hypothetical protein
MWRIPCQNEIFFIIFNFNCLQIILITYLFQNLEFIHFMEFLIDIFYAFGVTN